MKNPSTERATAVAQAQGRADHLHSLTDPFGHHFPRSEPRQRVIAYLKGLLGPVERKNGWQLAEQAGDTSPYGMQHLLGRARWDADAVRDDLQAYVIEHLADPDGVLILDGTGFIKKGSKSAGVARQYSGTAGRIENCQIGVFLAYASAKGRTFLDRELYLPKAWTEDGERCQMAGIPQGVKFATKLQLGRRMLERAFESGVPARWVTGDSVYGNDWRMRSWLEERKQAYVLGVTSQYRIFARDQRRWARDVIAALPEQSWQACSCGAGSKGERLYEWARLPLRKVDSGCQRWLLAGRSISDPKGVAYYVASGPEQTQLEEMARVAGTRWAIEESFETAKGEVGLDHYEVRNWAGWYRHITLAMLAHAYLTVVRSRATDEVARGEKKRSKRGARVQKSCYR
ncbi:MAG: IS701 family transposase [Blastocatellia bacterium]